MHEYSIVSALIRQVELEAANHRANRVGRVHLGIGELSGVDPELLALAFETFRAQTVCADAELSIRAVPALWRCPNCTQDLVAGSRLQCEGCGHPAELRQGDEIMLERLEMEVPDV
ncbi:MAG: hydrogenase maturation nickel metallochaperone HypA [Myxococcales bacterium]|nr:hydrogenase maturation nickel metallochaperone HypA [Myxococcales bacterium]